eukprot:GFUD01022367.1.p1 GENE.GFUD01022367.1~~GFUD01022367.1.p1  ORF type:complete len:270 (+),score=64.02 GFUD01022367.1:53-862(+)
MILRGHGLFFLSLIQVNTCFSHEERKQKTEEVDVGDSLTDLFGMKNLVVTVAEEEELEIINLKLLLKPPDHLKKTNKPLSYSKREAFPEPEPEPEPEAAEPRLTFKLHPYSLNSPFLSRYRVSRSPEPEPEPEPQRRHNESYGSSKRRFTLGKYLNRYRRDTSLVEKKNEERMMEGKTINHKLTDMVKTIKQERLVRRAVLTDNRKQPSFYAPDFLPSSDEVLQHRSKRHIAKPNRSVLMEVLGMSQSSKTSGLVYLRCTAAKQCPEPS